MEGFDSYSIHAGNDVNSLSDRRPKMLSGTSQASLAAKTNCKDNPQSPVLQVQKDTLFCRSEANYFQTPS